MSATVLLADHFGLVREAVRALIESRPDWVVVGEAADGRQAVELAERLHPDVAVLESLMPRLSGVDAAREIGRRSPSTRVLFLSSQNRQSVVQSAFEAGARGYVLKTSSAKEFLNAIEVVLEGRSYLSPDVVDHVVDALRHGKELSATGLGTLTGREREVLQLVSEGLSSKEVSAALGVSLRTVESYRANLMDKLGIHKVSSLVRYAIREGLIDA